MKAVQADVNKSVGDAQAKVTGIPALATGALGKLTVALAGGASADASTTTTTTTTTTKKK